MSNNISNDSNNNNNINSPQIFQSPIKSNTSEENNFKHHGQLINSEEAKKTQVNMDLLTKEPKQALKNKSNNNFNSNQNSRLSLVTTIENLGKNKNV